MHKFLDFSMKSKRFFYVMSEYTTMIVSITLSHANKKIISIFFKNIYRISFLFFCVPELMHNIIIIIIIIIYK